MLRPAPPPARPIVPTGDQRPAAQGPPSRTAHDTPLPIRSPLWHHPPARYPFHAAVASPPDLGPGTYSATRHPPPANASSRLWTLSADPRCSPARCPGPQACRYTSPMLPSPLPALSPVSRATQGPRASSQGATPPVRVLSTARLYPPPPLLAAASPPSRAPPHLQRPCTPHLPVSSPAPLVGSAPVLADNTILHPTRAVRAAVLLQAASAARPRPVRLAPSRHRPRGLSVDLRSPSPASAAERSVRRGVERLGSRHSASAHRFGSGSKSFDAVYLPRAFGERLVFSCVTRVLRDTGATRTPNDPCIMD
ncbi:hypothetical protein AcV7_010270 [Taiwanofungus camphoratus]|nr:hypothetical protein AcV7_010270 [Antrodia cinnamomea]